MVYSLPLPADRVDAVARRAAELLALDAVWVDRIKPKPRKLNIRQYLRGIEVSEPEASATVLPEDRRSRFRLGMDLWVTGGGTARADELLLLLGVSDLLEAGSVLARSELELRDETPPGQPDAPPDGPPDTAPLEYTPAAAGDDDPADPTWGLSPNGPVVE